MLSSFVRFWPSKLKLSASSPAETLVYNALPPTTVPTDLGDVNTVSVSNSIARAMGLLDPTALLPPNDPAAKIGFNSNFSYNFDPSDGIDPFIGDTVVDRNPSATAIGALESALAGIRARRASGARSRREEDDRSPA